MTDLLPTGLILDSTSNVSIEDLSAGVTDPVGTDEGAGCYYTLTDPSGRYLLTYTSVSPISTEQELTFSTPLPSDYFDRDTGVEFDSDAYNFSNYATLNAEFEVYNVDVNSNTTAPDVGASSVLDKKCVSYNYTTQTATWQITVDKNQAPFSGAQITDTIPSDQTYQGDASFYTDSSFSSELSAPPCSVSQNNQVLTWELGDIDAGNTYYIQYTTRLDDSDAAQNGSYQIKDSAQFQADGVTPTVVNPYYEISRDVITKSSDYNYVTREITWSIDVNNNRMVLTGDSTSSNGVVVEDNLSTLASKNFFFDTSQPVVVYSQDAPSTQIVFTPVKSLAALTASDTYYYDPVNEIIYFNLGDLNNGATAAREQIIQFDTIQTQPDTFFANNGTLSVSNTASLIDDQYSGNNAQGSCTQNISNNSLKKTGQSPTGADYIDWQVVINQNQINLGTDVVLQDELPAHLTLDTYSVALYQQTLQSNGSFETGSGPYGIDASNPVTISPADVSYDHTTADNTFKFTIPGTGNITAPYILTFRTYVDKDQSGNDLSIPNTITFEGSSSGISSTSSAVAVYFQWGQGAAVTPTGSLIVNKKDSLTGSNVEGAEYELLDSYNNVVQVQTTNSGGNAEFDSLSYGTYTVEESSAPDGYYSNNTSQTITVNSQNSQTLNFTDSPKVDSIQVEKTDDLGNALSGASFTLYNSSGTAVSTQSTSVSGIAQFSNVEFGTYTVKETAAPSGYLVNPNTQSVTISDSDYQTIQDLTFTDDLKGVITVTKTDSTNSSTKLAGAVFELLNGSGTDLGISATTDSAGTAVFQDCSMEAI